MEGRREGGRKVNPWPIFPGICLLSAEQECQRSPCHQWAERSLVARERGRAKVVGKRQVSNHVTCPQIGNHGGITLNLTLREAQPSAITSKPASQLPRLSYTHAAPSSVYPSIPCSLFPFSFKSQLKTLF